MGRRRSQKILFPSFLCPHLLLAESLLEPEWVLGIDHLQSNSSSLTDKETKVNDKFHSSRVMLALKSFHTCPPGFSAPLGCQGGFPGAILGPILEKESSLVSFALEQTPERLFIPPHFQT